MEKRKARPGDLPRAMEIFYSAQSFMIASGNPTQWGRKSPTRESLEEHVREGNLWMISEDGRDCGVFVLLPKDQPDPAYSYIEDGAWPNDEPYVTIHKVASDGSVRGIFRFIFNYARSLSDNVRIDTHENNRPMQRRILENGFVKCGTVYMADGTPRWAYQWIREPLSSGASQTSP